MFRTLRNFRVHKLLEREAVLKARIGYLHMLNTGKTTNSYYLDQELDLIGEMAKVQHRIRELTDDSLAPKGDKP